MAFEVLDPFAILELAHFRLAESETAPSGDEVAKQISEIRRGLGNSEQDLHDIHALPKSICKYACEGVYLYTGSHGNLAVAGADDAPATQVADGSERSRGACGAAGTYAEPFRTLTFVADDSETWRHLPTVNGHP